nr:immunoglobulin light chain junction region [Mus musculus]NSM00100.1 immunoglobulin light chain junction region [Mus musculus]
CQHFWSTPYTF